MNTLSLKNKHIPADTPPAKPATLEQQRAQFAWDNASMLKETLPSNFKDFATLAKGAPALIMNNGLMQTLAYYQDKGTDERGQPKRGQEHILALSDILQRWVGPRALGIGTPKQAPGFKQTMEKLLTSDAHQYRQATDEALLILRWIRQFAAAL